MLLSHLISSAVFNSATNYKHRVRRQKAELAEKIEVLRKTILQKWQEVIAEKRTDCREKAAEMPQHNAPTPHGLQRPQLHILWHSK